MTGDTIGLIVFWFVLPAFLLGLSSGMVVKHPKPEERYVCLWGIMLSLGNTATYGLLFRALYRPIDSMAQYSGSALWSLGILTGVGAVSAGLGCLVSRRSCEASSLTIPQKRGWGGAWFGLYLLVVLMSLSLGSGSRAKGRVDSNAGRLKQIGLALRMYSGDHDEHFPPDLGILLGHSYLRSPKAYICMNSKTSPPENGDDIRSGRCDYVYLGTGHTEATCSTETAIVVSKPGVLPEGTVLVLYGDGHVEKHLSLPSGIEQQMLQAGKTGR